LYSSRYLSIDDVGEAQAARVVGEVGNSTSIIDSDHSESSRPSFSIHGK
jgi:hypothetical protein